jgi:hyperosmotically inducible periplasmic protein
MNRKLLGTLLLGAAVMLGASKGDKPAPGTDAAITAQVRHEVVMYPYYTIWDDISYRVNNGQVELQGAVNQPFKKFDIEKIVRQIPGVTSVSDDIKVLPLSNMDDRLRIQVARAIYRDPVLSRYGMNPLPTIHVIVDNGHVTLTGVVSTEMEKQVAGMRASGAGLSFGNVVNNLRVENPSKKS